jgi:hypothetical protein
MKIIISVLLIEFVSMSSLFAAPPKKRADAASAERVALVQLIVTPERYRNRLVEVIGYCLMDVEVFAIYLSKEDADAVNIPASISLDGFKDGKDYTLTEEKALKIKNHYVRVVGIFKLSPSEHGGLWHASLTQIEGIMPAKQ